MAAFEFDHIDVRVRTGDETGVGPIIGRTNAASINDVAQFISEHWYDDTEHAYSWQFTEDGLEVVIHDPA